jgi:hypothetical protein
MDARGTPPGIRRGHLRDECGDLGADGSATSAVPTRKLGPVLAEAATLPTQDGVGRHDDQRLPPTGPESGEAGPEQAVSRAELRPGRCSLVHGALLAQGQVLEASWRWPPTRKGKSRSRWSTGVITSRDCGRTRPRDQPLAGRTGFGEAQVDSKSARRYKSSQRALLGSKPPTRPSKSARLRWPLGFQPSVPLAWRDRAGSFAACGNHARRGLADVGTAKPLRHQTPTDMPSVVTRAFARSRSALARSDSPRRFINVACVSRKRASSVRRPNSTAN